VEGEGGGGCSVGSGGWGVGKLRGSIYIRTCLLGRGGGYLFEPSPWQLANRELRKVTPGEVVNHASQGPPKGQSPRARRKLDAIFHGRFACRRGGREEGLPELPLGGHFSRKGREGGN